MICGWGLMGDEGFFLGGGVQGAREQQVSFGLQEEDGGDILVWSCRYTICASIYRLSVYLCSST